MKLIDKAAVVTEIERIEKSIGSDRFLSEFETGCNQGKEDVCDDLRAFLNSLEVKEVDLEKEVIDWWNAHYSGKDYTFEGYTGHYLENFTIIEIAKHFFELGLKVQKGV